MKDYRRDAVNAENTFLYKLNLTHVASFRRMPESMKTMYLDVETCPA